MGHKKDIFRSILAAFALAARHRYENWTRKTTILVFYFLLLALVSASNGAQISKLFLILRNAVD